MERDANLVRALRQEIADLLVADQAHRNYGTNAIWSDRMRHEDRMARIQAIKLELGSLLKRKAS